jgi:two-component system, OmpR family, response regulator
MPTQHILIVEDDAVLAAVLTRQLEKHGYRAEVEGHGGRAVERVRAMAPDAVILDGNLPGMDGFDVCRELRTSFRGVIIMLTGRDGDMDRVLGLELGADDYLVKPVEPRVVAAHLKACLRRVEVAPASGSNELRYGTFRISQADRAVHLGEREIPFTTAEFDLLWMLAENAGTVLTRDQIMAGVRRIEHDGLDRSIDMRVSRLRKRLGDDADSPRRIKTVRGKGYLFSPSDWD